MAVVLVVLYHVGWGASGGFVGVDVFFVISGFLITGQLVRELSERRRVSFLGFYARRARRILPAATVVIVVTAIASRLILNPDAARRALTDAFAAVFYAANFRFAAEGANYFNSTLPPSPLLHFWSLAVEEQFYLLWPVLLVVSSLVWLRRGAREPAGGENARRAPAVGPVVAALGALVILSFVISLLQTIPSPSWAYYSIFTRGWELAVGSLAALARPLAERLDPRAGAALSWVGLGLIVLSAVVLDASTPYPGTAALLPVAGAAAVIVGGCPDRARGGASLVLGTVPFQQMGAWSYSLYLWHWPVLILGPDLLGRPFDGPEAAAAVATSVLLAVASYRFVELPVRRIQVVVRRPRLGLAGAFGMAGASLAVVATTTFSLPVLAATGAAVHPLLSSGGSLTSAQLAADLAAGVSTKAAPSNLTPSLAADPDALPLIVKNGCHLQRPQTRSKPCVYGDLRSRFTVVLFGDSHAAAWFPALETIATRQHWRLVDLTKAGCPPVEVAIADYPQCTTWRKNAMATISRLHPNAVIASWARYVEEPEAGPLAGVAKGHGSSWDNGVAAIFGFLERRAGQVVFLSDTPTQSQDAPDCISGHLRDVQPCTTPRAAATLLASVKAAEISLAERDGVQVIDPLDWFCDAQRCPVIVGNIIVYRDNAHMTPRYSDFIEPVLAGALVPLVDGKRPSLSPGSASRS